MLIPRFSCAQVVLLPVFLQPACEVVYVFVKIPVLVFWLVFPVIRLRKAFASVPVLCDTGRVSH